MPQITRASIKATDTQVRNALRQKGIEHWHMGLDGTWFNLSASKAAAEIAQRTGLTPKRVAEIHLESIREDFDHRLRQGLTRFRGRTTRESPDDMELTHIIAGIAEEIGRCSEGSIKWMVRRAQEILS